MLETIDSVCEQQDDVLNRLQREQLSLERQLQEGGCAGMGRGKELDGKKKGGGDCRFCEQQDDVLNRLQREQLSLERQLQEG